MKATVDRKEFANAVKAASLAVNRRADLPILRCLRLEVLDGFIAVEGTDLEALVRRNVPCRGKNGALAVDYKKLGDALKACRAETVKLTRQEGGWLAVESGGTLAKIATLDAAKFPPSLKTGQEWTRFSLPGDAMARLLDKTAFCASTDEGRVNLNGCYLERGEVKGEPCLRMVATDGHRLAVTETPWDGELPAPMLIPRAALKPLAELAERGESLDCAARPTGEEGVASLCVSIGGADWVYVRLCEKEFPDWRQVVPDADALGVTFQVEADDLADALKAVTALSTDRSKAVKFEAATNLESIVLSATNCDRELATQKVRVSGLDWPFEPIGFNAKYMLEALAKAKGGTVEVGMGADCLCPAVLENVADPFWRYVVMPMRITL